MRSSWRLAGGEAASFLDAAGVNDDELDDLSDAGPVRYESQLGSRPMSIEWQGGLIAPCDALQGLLEDVSWITAS